MPTYEYECAACGANFEEFQSMSDKPLRKCPKCGKMKLERLIGAGAGIIFKGSGFYETDYKRKAAAGPDAGASPADKPAAKTEDKGGTPPPESGGAKPAKEAS